MSNGQLNSMSNYQTAFDQKIIPNDFQSTQYINLQHSNFTDSQESIVNDYILVDSSNRNWDKEESNSYTIILDQTYEYVCSIELMDGFIPVSGYVINEHNNCLYFQETKHQINVGDYCIASLSPGCYDIITLLNHLTVAMNQVSSIGNKYKCTLDSMTHRVTISCIKSQKELFNLIFSDGDEVIGDRGFMETLVIDPYTQKKCLKKIETSQSRKKYIVNSIGKILGFKAINLLGQLKYVGQQTYNLRPYEYIALFVDTENSHDFNKISVSGPNNGGNNAFAIIQMERESDGFELSSKRHQIIENLHYTQTFDPPISFNKLKICYMTPAGHLYDFNGLDNYLLFEIKRVYNRSSISKH